MVFSSPIFIFGFLPLVLLLVLLSGSRKRNILLLIASIVFYAWGEGELVLILLASILMNYFSGILIHYTKGSKTERIAFGLTIVANLGMLFFFKYTNFFLDNLNPLFIKMGIDPILAEPIHLPIGISFFTFQGISYVVDVYREDTEVQKNPFDLALYIALFPQLIAGPIVRYSDIAAQLGKRLIDRDGFAYGVKRFIEGLGKKVLIANTMAYVADTIFALAPEELSIGIAWMGILSYTFQLYFDFSGYSDMAIGLSRIFGFKIPENFDFPLISQSVTEFWRRWHISLSTWFRDYFYTPVSLLLSQRIDGRLSIQVSVVLTFLLIGLWHGASWTFAAFGLYHALFLVLEGVFLLRVMDKVWRPLKHFYALFILIFSAVFFRADTIGYSFDMMRALMGFTKGTAEMEPIMFLNAEFILAFIAAVIFCTPVVKRIRSWFTSVQKKNNPEQHRLYHVYNITSIILYVAVFLLVVMYLAVDTYNPFIYFRF